MRHPDIEIDGFVVDEATFEAAGHGERGWVLVDETPEPTAELVPVTDIADELDAIDHVPASDPDDPNTDDATPSDIDTDAHPGEED